MSLENEAGKKFRHFLEDNFLAAANTFAHVSEGADTFFNINTGKASRIAFIVVPLGLLHTQVIKKIVVDHYNGSRLQLIRVPRAADHRPLMCRFNLRLGYTGREAVQHWNYDQIMLTVMTGQWRAEFVGKLERMLQAKAAEWANVSMQSSTDIWEWLNNLVHACATDHFCRKDILQPTLALRERRQELLLDR